MYCKICGDTENLSKMTRFWSADDGWITGRLCPFCLSDTKERGPKPGDYAYDDRHKMFADVDQAISDIYG